MNEYYFMAFIIVIFALIVVALLFKFGRLRDADIEVPFAKAKLKGEPEKTNLSAKSSKQTPIGIDIQPEVETGDVRIGKAAAGSIIEDSTSSPTSTEGGTGVRIGKKSKLGNITIDEAAGGDIIKPSSTALDDD